MRVELSQASMGNKSAQPEGSTLRNRIHRLLLSLSGVPIHEARGKDASIWFAHRSSPLGYSDKACQMVARCSSEDVIVVNAS
jgi:hypothetical protein